MEHYEAYLALRPEDVEARIRAGRLLLRQGRRVEAAAWFRRAVEEGYATDGLLVWYLEALYAAGEYGELRRQAAVFAQRAAQFTQSSPRLAAGIALWAGEAAGEREAA